MKVKYLIQGITCLTKCPNGQTCQAGSHACSKCDNFISRTQDTVICDIHKDERIFEF
jgi:hypothetical protein